MICFKLSPLMTFDCWLMDTGYLKAMVPFNTTEWLRISLNTGKTQKRKIIYFGKVQLHSHGVSWLQHDAFTLKRKKNKNRVADYFIQQFTLSTQLDRQQIQVSVTLRECICSIINAPAQNVVFRWNQLEWKFAFFFRSSLRSNASELVVINKNCCGWFSSLDRKLDSAEWVDKGEK